MSRLSPAPISIPLHRCHPLPSSPSRACALISLPHLRRMAPAASQSRRHSSSLYVHQSASPIANNPTFHLRVRLTKLQIDVQWLPPSLCSLQSRVTSDDPRGCFVLNHDTIDHTSRRTLNSTEDLIMYLPQSPSMQAASLETHLSLCFKGCGGLLCPCGVSSGSSNSSTSTSSTSDWLSLVDDLLDKLNATIVEHSLNVRIILDGAANPAATHSPCLSQRWRPLPSLFTAGDGTLTPLLRNKLIFYAFCRSPRRFSHERQRHVRLGQAHTAKQPY